MYLEDCSFESDPSFTSFPTQTVKVKFNADEITSTMLINNVDSIWICFFFLKKFLS